MPNLQQSPPNPNKRPYSASSSSCGSSDTSDNHLHSPMTMNSFNNYPQIHQNHYRHHTTSNIMESPPNLATIDASAAMFPSCNFGTGYVDTNSDGTHVFPNHQHSDVQSNDYQPEVHHQHQHQLLQQEPQIRPIHNALEHIDVPLYSNTHQYSPSNIHSNQYVQNKQTSCFEALQTSHQQEISSERSPKRLRVF